MGQHQIPQEISSYEFRLVGSMTLKQFSKMAVGVIIAALVYTSHLPGPIRLFLAATPVIASAAFAFVPVNGRPLESWLLIFFHRVYSPTIYLWKKTPGIINLDVFSHQARHARFFQKVNIRGKSQKAKEFIASLPKHHLENPIKQQNSTPINIPKEPPGAAQVSPVAKTGAAVSPTPPTSGPNSGVSSWDQLMKIWQDHPEEKKAEEAKFMSQALPATPTQPNIISGLIADNENHGIEGAIVEIQDAESNPVRAMRTNGLGQFQTATPLPNGDYLIVTEKEPYQFDIMKIVAKGQIISPLKIVAKQNQPAHERY